jgi:tetratricopeptide (TPR) repeat protein
VGEEIPLKFKALGLGCVAAAIAAIACGSVAALAADAPVFTFPQKPGKYAVGLKVVNQYDYSRTYIAVDALGKPVATEVARPMQTFVWYPAEAGAKPQMQFGDYVDLAAMKDTFAPSAAKLASIVEEKKQFASLIATPVWAVKDAAAVKGTFPVVIYAPSFSNYPFENADLCEFLASHGYVVVASPSNGAHQSGMTGDVAGINAQAADIGFLIGYAKTLPQADLSRIAVAGFSWGGISNLFAAARDARVKALVSLDGSARYFPKLVKDSGDVKPAEIAVPILFFEQELSAENMMKYKIDMSGSVLNDLKFSDLTMVHMHAMHHGDFASLFQRSADYVKGREATDYSMAEAAESYGWVCQYAVEFLDSVLKQDAEATAWWKKSPVENGVPKHLLSVERAPAVGTPVTFEAFRMDLAKTGFSAAITEYAKFKARDSEFKLDEGAIGAWGASLEDNGHYVEEVEVYKLGVSLNPESAGMYAGLGDGYAKSGESASAIVNYKKALEKDPKDEGVKKKLAEVEAKAK